MRVSQKLFILCCLGIGIALTSVEAAETVDQQVSQLVTGTEVQTFQQELALCSSVLELGPDAVTSLCGMLNGPNDARMRTILQSLAMAVGRDRKDPRQASFAQAIGKSLQSAKDKEVQVFLIEVLQVAGEDESVERLSGVLDDERLCEPAVRALTTIGTTAAKKALLSSLENPKTADKLAVILALGDLRVEQAAAIILTYADSRDAAICQAAQWALASIGYAPAANVLADAFQRAEGYPKDKVASNCVLLAQRLAEKGQTEKSASMCRALLAKPADQLSVPFRIAALDTLTAAVGSAALGDLTAAATGQSDPLQAAAVNLLGDLSGPQVTSRSIALLDTADARLAERLAEMLGRRGDTAALPVVLDLLGHSEDRVAAAAMTAAVRLDRDKAVPAILKMLAKTDSADRITTGVEVLMRLPGDSVLRAAGQSLATMPAASRIKLMEGLAGRQARSCSKQILAQTTDSDPAVRRAAIQAMANCASLEDLPTLLTQLLDTDNSAEQTGIQQAVVAAAIQNPDSEARADLILKRLEKASGDDKLILLRTAGKVGGSSALKTVLGYVKSDDSAVKDVAIRALADWPDAMAVDGLMQIVQTEELRYQVIALRQMLRLLQDAPVQDRRKVQLARQALDAVSRNEEKQLVLSMLGKIKTGRSLALAAHYLADESLRTTAAVAAANIALPDENGQGGLSGVFVADVLTDTLEALPDEAVQKRVREYLTTLPSPSNAQTKQPPAGFTALFNGKDLAGWQGVLLPPYDNPVRREKLSPQERKDLQAKADEMMRRHWQVRDGILYFDGGGFSLSTLEDYENFEMYVDWRLAPNGDSGIYLHGSPQVQIWDPADWPVGSGGLYNNQKNPSKPLVCADNPIGQWNTFHIKMVDQHVTVYLNEKLVVDNVILENYWDRSQPIFPTGPVELQCHGDPIWFNNIFIRRIPANEAAWVPLFNGKDLTGWTGNTDGYVVQDGMLVWKSGGNLYTEKEYDNFHFKVDFRLTPGANNGIGIRAPGEGNPAYEGMEIQILDDNDPQYAKLQPYQYDGSVYGVVPAKRGHLKPPGQWNTQEIIAKGNHISVILNGVVIVDADLADAIQNGTIDGNEHPGLKRSTGHIVLMGHGSEVAFKNMQLLKL